MYEYVWKFDTTFSTFFKKKKSVKSPPDPITYREPIVLGSTVLSTKPQQFFSIDQFTNFMHTILTKVVPDNLKACPRLVRHSNN